VRRAVCFVLFATCLAAAQNQIPKFGTTVVASSWFRGRIYHLHHWASHLPNFSKMKAIGAIYTPFLNVPPQSFSNGFPGVTNRYEFFGIDYTAQIWISAAGIYRFSLLSDDGADLYIDSRLIIDNDGEHEAREMFGQTQLSAGIHSVHVPYYQGPKFMLALVLKVQGPNDTGFRVLSTEDFKPPADRENWNTPPPQQGAGSH
jgi:PA14 domain-containing protein